MYTEIPSQLCTLDFFQYEKVLGTYYLLVLVIGSYNLSFDRKMGSDDVDTWPHLMTNFLLELVLPTSQIGMCVVLLPKYVHIFMCSTKNALEYEW